LSFPIPKSLTAGNRRVMVFTTDSSPEDRRQALQEQSAKVIVAGETSVDGKELSNAVGELDYQLVYSTAGPKIHHLLLSAGVVDRAYLSVASRMVGGSSFATIVEGQRLGQPAGFRLNSLYYDPRGLDALGQLFLSFDRSDG
jgi:riboflavin biosynthesis pyrimidine reductase